MTASMLALVLVTLLALPACSRKSSRRESNLPKGFAALSVEPTLAKKGDVLSIGFVAEKAPAGRPSVEVDGRSAELIEEPGENQKLLRPFRFQYAVTGEESKGEAEVTVRYAESKGKSHTATVKVEFDFTPPRIEIAGLFPGPADRPCLLSPAAVHSATLEFKSNEPLGVEPVARLGDRSARKVSVVGSYVAAEFDVALDEQDLATISDWLRESDDAPGVTRVVRRKESSRAGSNSPARNPAPPPSLGSGDDERKDHGVSASRFHVNVAASDRAGNRTALVKDMEWTPPPGACVIVKSPKEGDLISGNIRIDVEAEPHEAVAKVRVFLDQSEVDSHSIGAVRATFAPGSPLLGDHVVSILAVDKNGIWAVHSTTVRGVPSSLPGSPLGSGAVMPITEKDMGTARGVMGRVVKALLSDSGRGAVWVGSSGGVMRFDGRQFESYGIPEGLATDIIEALAMDADGRLWAGGAGGVGVFEGGSWRGVASGSSPVLAEVHALAGDPDGGMWAGTSAGLAAMGARPLKVGVVLTTEHGLPHNEVLAAVFDSEGIGWIGTKGGLARMERSGGEVVFEPVTESEGLVVTALLPDPRGGLWVGTWGEGLYFFEIKGGRVAGVRRVPNLPSQTVWSLWTDGESVWAALEGGAARIVGENVEWVLPSDGLLHSSVRSVIEDPWGGRWFGTLGGITRVGG